MKASDYVYTLNHQSPNHTNKKQESADKLVVQQIINQNVAKKNLRNPDYFSTSIISSTTNVLFIFLSMMIFFYRVNGF